MSEEANITPQNESYVPKNVTIKHRVKNKDQWTIDDTLLPREIGYEYDTGKFKIAPPASGDEEIHSTPWTEIDNYFLNIGRGTGINSTTEGNNAPSAASGNYSHAEGYQTQAYGQGSHTEGYQVQTGLIDDATAGKYAHAEGSNTKAIGFASHAEGKAVETYGENSHAEGFSTQTGYESSADPQGSCAHAEGYETIAYGNYSHTEGLGAQAIGEASHAEGCDTVANHDYSHVSGIGTVSTNGGSFVIGQYNRVPENANYLFVIGNGTANARNNLLTIDNNETPTLQFNGTISAQDITIPSGSFSKMCEGTIPEIEVTSNTSNNFISKLNTNDLKPIYLCQKRAYIASYQRGSNYSQEDNYGMWSEYFIPTPFQPQVVYVTSETGATHHTEITNYGSMYGFGQLTTYYGGLLTKYSENDNSILFAKEPIIYSQEYYDIKPGTWSQGDTITTTNIPHSLYGAPRNKLVNTTNVSFGTAPPQTATNTGIVTFLKDSNSILPAGITFTSEPAWANLYSFYPNITSSTSYKPIIRIPHGQIEVSSNDNTYSSYGFFVYIDDTGPLVYSAQAGNHWFCLG